MTCFKCNGTGQIYEAVYSWGYSISPCSCEYSMRNRQVLEQELQTLRQRMAEAYARFSAERKAN